MSGKLVLVLAIWFCVTLAGGDVGADVFNMPAGVKSLEMVVVGNPGNPADANRLGTVPYAYKIGKYEVTTSQYVEFLNAKAKSDRDGNLWFNDMDRNISGGSGCNIHRKGEKGNYTHFVEPEFADVPVNQVSFLDACRFCNWLHNGQGDGDTEDGAYTLNGYTGTDGRRVKRNPGARFFIPTEDEWYKAAYYDPNKPGGPGYWDYPTRSDAKPNRDFAGSNSANYYAEGYLDPVMFLAKVGSFPQSPGPYGTLDQAGNLFEWTEGLIPPFLRMFWGGSFATTDAGINVRPDNQDTSSQSDVSYIGFRVASAVPGVDAPGKPQSFDTGQNVKVQFPRRPWRNPENGKAFFPLAWFTWASDEADLDQMARENVNTVLFVEAFVDVDDEAKTDASIKRMRQYLDRAHKRGIKVLPQLGGWYGAHMRSDTAEIARQRKWVEAICKHPALLGYQLYDEPEYKAGGGLNAEVQKERTAFVDGLGKLRESLRQWDSNRNHMVQVVYNLVPLSSWTAYLPVIDSFQVDRYPCDSSQAFFGHRGDWGPLFMAWSMAHGVAALDQHPHLRNPSPCMQGVGLSHTEVGQLGVWRNPLYEETRYMAYSSLTVGSWGIFHWIRNPSSPYIRNNVATLYRELRQLFPAFEQSYEKPPFTVRHNHNRITRDFLTDCIPDLTTLELEDAKNYYLIVSDNSGVLEDVNLRLKLPGIKDTSTRSANVLNEDWARDISYDQKTGEWAIVTHKMCFGDINIWVIPKAEPKS